MDRRFSCTEPQTPRPSANPSGSALAHETHHGASVYEMRARLLPIGQPRRRPCCHRLATRLIVRHRPRTRFALQQHQRLLGADRQMCIPAPVLLVRAKTRTLQRTDNLRPYRQRRHTVPVVRRHVARRRHCHDRMRLHQHRPRGRRRRVSKVSQQVRGTLLTQLMTIIQLRQFVAPVDTRDFGRQLPPPARAAATGAAHAAPAGSHADFSPPPPAPTTQSHPPSPPGMLVTARRRCTCNPQTGAPQPAPAASASSDSVADIGIDARSGCAPPST